MDKTKIKLYLGVFIFFWALFALTNNGLDISQGTYHYKVAEQIIRYGRLDFDYMPPKSVFSIAPNGKYYASHEIGNALFLLPTAFINVSLEKVLSIFLSKEGIKIIQLFIFSFQSGFYSAITATTFFGILRTRFFQPISLSFAATLCLAVTTFFWTFSRSLFDGVLCSTLLTLSFFFLSSYYIKKNYSYIIFSFVLLGIAFITRISMIIPIIASIVYLFIIIKPLSLKLNLTGTILLVLIPFFIWQGWYNNLRTGVFYISPVQTAKYTVNNALDGNLLVGLLGYLVSPGKSIFVYAPLLILSVLVSKRFYKSFRNESIYIVVLFVLWLLLHSRMRSWYGAWGWGPRYFITILPILMLPFAVNINYILRHVFLRISAVILGFFGFALALSSIISNYIIRINYAVVNGRFDDKMFVWGFWNSQSIDMLKAPVENVLRILNHAPLPRIAKFFPQPVEDAASTINVWANYIGYVLHIPLFVRVSLVIFLLFIMYLSLREIFKTIYTEQRREFNA